MKFGTMTHIGPLQRVMVISSWRHNICSLCPYRFDMPLSFVSLRRRPCVWYAGHGGREATSDRLIASAERPVTIIPLTIGFSVTGKKPVSANRLPVPKNKRF